MVSQSETEDACKINDLKSVDSKVASFTVTGHGKLH
jgi:hypothetical protein